MRSQKLIPVVEALGSSSLIGEALRAAMEAFRGLVPYDRGLALVLQPRVAVPVEPPVLINISIELFASYVRNSDVAYDRSFLAARAAGLRVARSTDVLDYSVWTQDPVYRLIYQPMGTHYELLAIFSEGTLTYGKMNFYRSASRGDFSDDDVGLLENLYPHFVNRLKWHHALREAQRVDAVGEQAGGEHPFADLTERELRVTELVIAGAENSEIARIMGISENTVKMHLQNTFDKLGIKRRNQLASLFMSSFITPKGPA